MREDKEIRYGKPSPAILTIRQDFRKKHGYNRGKTCGECAFFYTYCGDYHKCKKMGWPHTANTDIQAKRISCNLFERARPQLKGQTKIREWANPQAFPQKTTSYPQNNGLIHRVIHNLYSYSHTICCGGGLSEVRQDV